MEIDSKLLEVVLFNHDYMKSNRGWNESGKWKTLTDLDAELGFKANHIRQCLDRGRMSYYNLDKVACHLGYHPSLFIRSEYLLPDDALEAEALIMEEVPA
jgi:hypothetical protein